jgi:holo-[acyl-carrier protein] synthase
MIYGIGTDVVEVKRIEEKIAKGKGFKEKTFTAGEIAYCEGKARSAEHFAARFAAKEALSKAFGTGWTGQCEIIDVEIINNEAGKPVLKLHSKAKAIGEKAGIGAIHVSLSHVSDVAVAMVVLERKE